MKNLVILTMVSVTFLIGLTSCGQDDENFGINTCAVENPAEEIEWIRKVIESHADDEYSTCMMADYQGETVFYHSNCNPLENWSFSVLNCEGEVLGILSELRDELTNITTIWKHEDSRCD